MTDETKPTPEPETAEKKTKRDQDRALADLITAARQTIQTAQGDAEVSALLSPRGYDAAKLAEGLALQEAAQSGFSARQEAIAAQQRATAGLLSAQAEARQVLADFRETARGVFKDNAARAGLGLVGTVPIDLQEMITAARTSYNAALRNPEYLAQLSKYGFPQAKLESAKAMLDSLESADNAQEVAKARSVRATEERDAAAKALKAWISQFRAIAKVATRGRPDLLKKIGL
jgi:hypothetical protein